MIDLQNMAVAVYQKAEGVVEASCPGEADWDTMFEYYNVDLTQEGEVTFPYWYKQPVVAKTQGETPQCIFWGTITMTRDTAVFLVKQALWALMSETIPQGENPATGEPYWQPPDTGDPATYDCETAKYMTMIARQLYGVQNFEDLAGWPIDGGVFAYLMTYHPTIQALAKAAAADYPALQLGQPWTEGNALMSPGGAVVPPPLEDKGSKFVPMGVPETCVGGTTPDGTLPGQPPAIPGTEGVGAKEDKWKLPSWALPAGLFVGGAAIVGGAVWYGYKSQREAEGFGL